MWVWPKNPVVDDDHDDDRAPESHEGGEEGVGEVGVEHTEPGLVVNGWLARPIQFDQWQINIKILSDRQFIQSLGNFNYFR